MLQTVLLSLLLLDIIVYLQMYVSITWQKNVIQISQESLSPDSILWVLIVRKRFWLQDTYLRHLAKLVLFWRQVA